MNPLTETFSEEDIEVDVDTSFESKVYAEIERVKQKLRDLEPSEEEITFYFDQSGVAIMVIGNTPDHDLSNEYERQQFQTDSETYYLLRKLEDLHYAKKYGEFPDEKPMHEIADPDELP